MNNTGLLIVLSGPSGAGKDTILKYLLKNNDNIKLSISATTRNPRTGEKDGEDYFFISKEKFNQMVSNNQMLEHAEYCGNYYGTPSEPIQKWMESGNDVILEIEVQGGSQIKQKCPNCISIFILPPSVKVLEQRLRDRQTETEEAIQKRLTTAKNEILKASDYDYIVVNDTVDHASAEINCIISAEKHKYIRASTIIEGVLNNA